MERTPPWLLGSLALLLGACGGASSLAVAPPGVLSLRAPVEVTARQLTPQSRLTVNAASYKTGSASQVALRPLDLRLRLRTGERARVEELEIPLGDVEVAASALPPSGLRLRDLQLGLDEPADLVVQAVSDRFLEAHTAAPLRLAWSVVLEDGTLYALGPALTDPISLDFEVERSEDGTLTTTRLYARCDGVCWSIDSLVRLSDGQIKIDAAADLAAAR